MSLMDAVELGFELPEEMLISLFLIACEDVFTIMVRCLYATGSYMKLVLLILGSC